MVMHSRGILPPPPLQRAECLRWQNTYIDEEAAFYRDLAEKFIGSVYRNYAVKDFEKSNGIVLHSTYSNRSPYNTCNTCGVDECNSWGDYFYMEALTRLQKDWQIYW